MATFRLEKIFADGDGGRGGRGRGRGKNQGKQNQKPPAFPDPYKDKNNKLQGKIKTLELEAKLKKLEEEKKDALRRETPEQLKMSSGMKKGALIALGTLGVGAGLYGLSRAIDGGIEKSDNNKSRKRILFGDGKNPPVVKPDTRPAYQSKVLAEHGGESYKGDLSHSKRDEGGFNKDNRNFNNNRQGNNNNNNQHGGGNRPYNNNPHRDNRRN